MIGILVPMDEEIELILQHIIISKSIESGMRTYYLGQLFDKEVVVAKSRIGKVASAVTAHFMITQLGAKLIYVLGVAGGVATQVAIGDVCIASASIQHDMDARGLFPQYEIPLLEKSYFEAPAELVENIYQKVHHYLQSEYFSDIPEGARQKHLSHSPNVHMGLLGSGDQFIGSKNKAEDLLKNLPDLLFVEMEGAAVAQVCYEHQVQVINIRVVSDHADSHAELDFQGFIDDIAKYMTLNILRVIL